MTSKLSLRSRIERALPAELLWFLLMSLVLWIGSIGVVLFHLRLGLHNNGFPSLAYSRPFWDLNIFADRIAFIHQEEFFSKGYRWIYPAPCVFLYKLLLLDFVALSHHKIAVIDLFYCAVVASGLLLLITGAATTLQLRGLSRRQSWGLIICVTSLSWPIFFAVRQGNIEGILWIGVAIAVWAFYQKMWWTSAIIIGIVGSFKIYPLFLLALFISPKKFFQAAGGVLIFAIITVGSLAYIGPTIPVASHHIAEGLASFTDLAFTPESEKIDRAYLTYEHSLVSLFRILTTGHPEYMSVMALLYLPITAVLMTVLFLAKVRNQPRINQLLVIVLAIVLLPPKSYDYTLQMLYIPWMCLALISISARAHVRKIPGLTAVMVLLAFLCSPEFFVKYQGIYSFGQFKAVCLILLFFVALYYRFEDEQIEQQVNEKIIL